MSSGSNANLSISSDHIVSHSIHSFFVCDQFANYFFLFCLPFGFGGGLNLRWIHKCRKLTPTGSHLKNQIYYEETRSETSERKKRTRNEKPLKQIFLFSFASCIISNCRNVSKRARSQTPKMLTHVFHCTTENVAHTQSETERTLCEYRNIASFYVRK